jgi:hypothetical protein
LITCQKLLKNAGPNPSGPGLLSERMDHTESRSSSSVNGNSRAERPSIGGSSPRVPSFAWWNLVWATCLYRALQTPSRTNDDGIVYIDLWYMINTNYTTPSDPSYSSLI